MSNSALTGALASPTRRLHHLVGRRGPPREVAAQDLSGDAPRHLSHGQELDVARLLVGREARAAPVDDLTGGHRVARPDDDACLDRLPPALVRDADDAGLLHTLELADHLLNLGGIHVLSPGLDQILLPIREGERAVVVADEDVTG